jgi:hypothetical protein
MVTPYLTNQNEAAAEDISAMTKQIENKEILRLFGGDALRDNQISNYDRLSFKLSIT